MDAASIYYIILFVYVSLWSCLMTTNHLTHSLIILTESYISLYRILYISLGLLHLKTQRRAYELCTKRGDLDSVKELRLFDRLCTYNFKRLPLLGSFINGLFLAALLMSAAIEGIQTCFHASHLDDGGKSSILLQHPMTYPSMLVAFAVVSLVTQWCSVKARELRDEELQTASALDLTTAIKSPRELKAEQLESEFKSNEGHQSQNSRCVDCHEDAAKTTMISLTTTKRNRHYEPIPSSVGDECHISLRSLNFNTDAAKVTSSNVGSLASISRRLEFGEPVRSVTAEPDHINDICVLVRYFVSPITLIVCACIIYFIDDEMVTEVADATLAIFMVISLFFASYPPMKRAAKILLQTAPGDIDVDLLRETIKSSNQLILGVKELHIWSLTPRSNRVATCHLLIDSERLTSTKELAILLEDVRSKFASLRVSCSSVQPILK